MKSLLLAVLRKHYKLLISVTLVVSLGFSLVWGLSGGYLSMEASFYKYVDDFRYPDGYITTEVTSSDDALKLQDIDGIRRCETRLCADTVAKTADGRYYSVRVFSYSDDEEQKFFRWSEYSGESDGVLLEYNFAESNGIKAGDVLSFRVRGEYRDYTVQGVISRPETFSAKISDNQWGINYDFGYVYAPASLLSEEYEKDYTAAKGDLDDKSYELNEEKTAALDLLDEKQKELDGAKKLLREKKKELRQSESDAEKALSELNKTKKELSASLAELKDNRNQIGRGIVAASDTAAALEEQYSKLTQAKSALDELYEAEQKLSETRGLLTGSGAQSLIRLIRLLPDDMKMSELIGQVRSVSEYLNELSESGFSYDLSDSVEELAELVHGFESRMDSDLAYLNSQQVKDLAERIAAGDTAEEESYGELIKVLLRYSAAAGIDRSKLPEFYRSVTARLQELQAEYRREDIAQILEFLRKLNTGYSTRELLSDVLSAEERMNGLLDGTDIEQLTAAQTLSLYDDAMARLDDGCAEIAQNRSKIISALGEYDIDEGSLSSSIKSLEDGISTAEKTEAELKDALEKLNNGISEVESGIYEVDKTIASIRTQLSDGRSKLESAEKEYSEGEKKLKSSYEDMKEFADLEDELHRAYEKLDSSEGYDKLCNQFLLYLYDDADSQAVLKQAEKALADSTVKDSYDFESSPVNKRIQINLEPIYSLMMIVPTVFLAIVLTVVFLFMSMIINQSRRETGIMMALGISKTSIRALYIAVSLMVSVGGIAIGSGVGLLLRNYIGGYFQQVFPLPIFCYADNPVGYALGAAACITVCVCAALLSTIKISRISPKDAMLSRTQSEAHDSAFSDRLTARFSPLLKFSVTSLLRNKGRFLFSTVCVAASVMLIFASISFIRSKNFIITQTFEQRMHYDCQIFLKERPSEELMDEIGRLDGVSGVEEVLIYDAELYSDFEREAQSVSIYALSPQNTMIGIYDIGGGPVALRSDEIVLERHTAERLGVSVGDTVYRGGVGITVGSISDQCVSRAQYIASDVDKLFGEPDLGCILCRFDFDVRRSLLDLLTDKDVYLYSVFSDSLISYNKRLFATYDLAAWIMIMFAVLTGFVIVFNTAMTNLQDSKRELCVLRTVGFRHGEISRSRFSQALLQFLTSFAVGLPAGIAFAKIALLSISTEYEEFAYASGAAEALGTAAIVFLYVTLSHFAAMRSMKKWNIIETVKDKE